MGWPHRTLGHHYSHQRRSRCLPKRVWCSIELLLELGKRAKGGIDGFLERARLERPADALALRRSGSEVLPEQRMIDVT
jgi:hypothetical protein